MTLTGTTSSCSSCETSVVFSRKPLRHCSNRRAVRPVGTASVAEKYTTLGPTDVRISKLGLGTLQWGDPKCGYGDQYSKEQLGLIFQRALEGGINFIDTAEVYGYQGNSSKSSSEHLVGSFAAASMVAPRYPLVIGTKFFTIPWTNVILGGGFRLGRDSLIAALKDSIARLGVDCVDLYQIHFPFPTFSSGVLCDALEQGRDQGLIKHVGVCNYNTQQMEEMHTELAKRDMQLVSNQVKYNVLQRDPETSGLLQRCAELKVTLIAHSPLEQGMLTAKKVDSAGVSDKVNSVLKLLQFIGVVYGGKSIQQVALNYLIAKGAVPIPGCKSVGQLSDHLGVLGWALEENEIAIIDERMAAFK